MSDVSDFIVFDSFFGGGPREVGMVTRDVDAL